MCFWFNSLSSSSNFPLCYPPLFTSNFMFSVYKPWILLLAEYVLVIDGCCIRESQFSTGMRSPRSSSRWSHTHSHTGSMKYSDTFYCFALNIVLLLLCELHRLLFHSWMKCPRPGSTQFRSWPLLTSPLVWESPYLWILCQSFLWTWNGHFQSHYLFSLQYPFICYIHFNDHVDLEVDDISLAQNLHSQKTPYNSSLCNCNIAKSPFEMTVGVDIVHHTHLVLSI